MEDSQAVRRYNLTIVRRATFRASGLSAFATAFACTTWIAPVASAQQPPAKPATKQPAEASTAKKAAPSATVGGRVTVPEGQKLPEMVVYLESTDPKFAFQVSADPITVNQQDAKFAPGLLVVPVGTKVHFSNDEKRPVEHNVFSNSEAKRFDLGLYKPGEPIEPVTFDTPGAVRLRCSIHRYMDGVVYVTPTPYFSVVGPDGRFTISGVKPGAYKLKTWQRSQRFREQDVPVKASAVKPADLTVEMSRK
jgi:plastocyanin